MPPKVKTIANLKISEKYSRAVLVFRTYSSDIAESGVFFMLAVICIYNFQGGLERLNYLLDIFGGNEKTGVEVTFHPSQWRIPITYIRIQE